jgi:hypothetical protein
MTARGWILAGLALATLALGACRTPPKPDTTLPPGYVTVPGEKGVLRSAVAPTGNRIVVRRHENPPEGTLEFWRDAVQAELIDGKGYELLESKQFAVHGGRTSWEFLFSVSRTEGDYLYFVLIRVSGRDVFVTEAGGRAEPMRADLEARRDALR